MKSYQLHDHLLGIDDLPKQEEPDIAAIKQSLEMLLEFLSSPEGRTHDHCCQTDTFFCLHDDRGVSWEHLPDELEQILSDIGGALHDTISAPEVARNFSSTPEQLLERVRKMKVE